MFLNLRLVVGGPASLPSTGRLRGSSWGFEDGEGGAPSSVISSMSMISWISWWPKTPTRESKDVSVRGRLVCVDTTRTSWTSSSRGGSYATGSTTGSSLRAASWRNGSITRAAVSSSSSGATSSTSTSRCRFGGVVDECVEASSARSAASSVSVARRRDHSSWMSRSTRRSRSLCWVASLRALRQLSWPKLASEPSLIAGARCTEVVGVVTPSVAAGDSPTRRDCSRASRCCASCVARFKAAASWSRSSARKALRRLRSRRSAALAKMASTCFCSSVRKSPSRVIVDMRAANLKQLSVSGTVCQAGEQQNTKRQREFAPPMTSDNRNVSFEFRYGTCCRFWSMASKASPSADSDLLIAVASLSAAPLAPLLATRSQPARSTRHSRPPFDVSTNTTTWLRLECALSSVAVVARRRFPALKTSKNTRMSSMRTLVRSGT
mmetsp:Transcript_7253/g.22329  ORF Transcript_7253/g.22329 Transcript_7253/m.22329 type:complete len:437 (+) Transcript_7253:775-2085(+)